MEGFLSYFKRFSPKFYIVLLSEAIKTLVTQEKFLSAPVQWH